MYLTANERLIWAAAYGAGWVAARERDGDQRHPIFTYTSIERAWMAVQAARMAEFTTRDAPAGKADYIYQALAEMTQPE